MKIRSTTASTVYSVFAITSRVFGILMFVFFRFIYRFKFSLNTWIIYIQSFVKTVQYMYKVPTQTNYMFKMLWLIRLNKTCDFVFTLQTKITLMLASTRDCCKCVAIILHFSNRSKKFFFFVFIIGSPILESARRHERIIQLIWLAVTNRASIGSYILTRLQHRPLSIPRKQPFVNRGQGSVVLPMSATSRPKWRVTCPMTRIQP